MSAETAGPRPRFADKVVVVTGAGRGIGQETAERFASEGATVVVVDIDADTARDAAAAIVASDGQALAVPADVSSSTAVDEVRRTVIDHFGRADVLVNAAGIFTVNTPIIDTSEAEWDRMFAVNVKSMFLMTRALVPEMVRNRAGAIVNFSSVSSFVGDEGTGVYCASKAAVTMLTRVAALELAPEGVRANAVAPGFIETDMSRAEIPDAESRRGFADYIPLGRLGEPADVARVVLFLASDDAAYVTGAVVVVDAGWTSQLPRRK